MSRAAPKATAAADAPPSAAVVALFDSLADPDDPELISMEGLQSLGDKVGLDASSDVKFLVLLWKLGAGSKPGCVTRTEFYKGMRTMRKESLDALRQMIPSLDPGFLERAEFREYYKFVFQFSREGTRKSIEKDLVVGLMQIVLDRDRTPHLDLFVEFLQTAQKPDLLVSGDQWDSFLQFNQLVEVGLQNYDEDNAWPLLLEEYVAWRRETKKDPI